MGERLGFERLGVGDLVDRGDRELRGIDDFAIRADDTEGFTAIGTALLEGGEPLTGERAETDVDVDVGVKSKVAALRFSSLGDGSSG